MYVRTFAARILPALALAALIAAGCGGDGSLSKNDYVEKNNAIQTKVQEASSKLTAASASDPKEAAKTARDMQGEIDAAIKEFKALNPPAEWEDEHADLVKAVTDMSVAMGAMATAAEKKDVKAMQKVVADISEAGVNASAAISAMNSSR